MNPQPPPSAATRLVGLVGWPVAHSLSPAMHEAAFAALGLDFRYLAFPVEPARLAEAVAGADALGVVGLNVTVPHKTAALALCDPDDDARRAGAVNTLVFPCAGAAGEGLGTRPRGLNTDVHGFRTLLAEAGIDASGGRAVVLGAGGAARAAVVALDDAGAAAIELVARHPRPVATGARTRSPHPWSEAQVAALLARCDLLVDATPRGLDPAIPPPDLSPLPAGANVIDVVVRPSTRLVEAARARGLRAVTGESMLLHQGARAFTAWTGQRAPIEVMRAALHAALAR